MTLPPVSVKPNPDFNNKNWPIGPKHIDLYKESYREHRQLSPLWSFDYEERNGEFGLDPPENKTIEPWKMLVIYSTEPDLYPDCDLNLHKNQKITGGSHGWRHMQFQALGTKFGIATESFRVHINLAGMAFENGNDYWGWRYLSRCAHYLADLGNPFHVKAVTVWFLIKKLFSSNKLFKIVSAVHQSYEVYVERRFREGFPPSNRPCCKAPVKGRVEDGDVQTQLINYINTGGKKHNPIFYYLF